MKLSKLFISTCLTVAACFGACFAINASRGETIELGAAAVLKKTVTTIKYDSSDYSIPYVLQSDGQPSPNISYQTDARFILVARSSTNYYATGKSFGASLPGCTIPNFEPDKRLDLSQDDANYRFFTADHIDDNGLFRFIEMDGNRNNMPVTDGSYLCARDNPLRLVHSTKRSNYVSMKEKYGDSADFRIEYIDGRARFSTSFVDNTLPFNDPIFLAYDGEKFCLERPGEESLDSDRYLFWVCKGEAAEISIQTRLSFDFDAIDEGYFERYTNFRNVKIQFRLDDALANESWKMAEGHALEKGFVLRAGSYGFVAPFFGYSDDELIARFSSCKLYFSPNELADTFTVGIPVPQEQWENYINVMAILRDSTDGTLFSNKTSKAVTVGSLLKTYKQNRDQSLSEREVSICSSFYSLFY